MVTTDWWLTFWSIFNLVLTVLLVIVIVRAIIKGIKFFKKADSIIDKADRFIDSEEAAKGRKNASGQQMRIEHIAMYVNELEAARDFFVKYLGGKSNDGYHNKNTGFRSFFISFDDGARIELMNKPEMQDMEKTLNRTGFIHIAFSVGSKEKVDELTEKLKADKYDVVSGPRTTGDGYYESCIVGIEGNQIEITV